MIVRRATQADSETLLELWRELMDAIEEPDYWRGTPEEASARIAEYVGEHVALLAEEGDGAVGYALARVDRPRIGYLRELYVRTEARRRGVATRLIAEVVATLSRAGAELLSVNVSVDSADARGLYARLGFREESVGLIARMGDLSARAAEREAGASFGSVHVQSDDLAAVERAVREFVPRLPGRSLGSVLIPPRNGWIAIYDELADREPGMLRRLARELSSRLGAVVAALGVEHGEVVRYVLFEGGRVVDEYLSVPEFYGALPPGDIVALAANPTVARRLTGADPEALRKAARTAASPAGLPPADELLETVASALGLEGGGRSYRDAREDAEAIDIPRAQGR